MQLDDSIAEIQISAIWLQSYGNRKKSKVVSRVCAPRLGPFFASSPPRPLDILTRLHDELARRLQVLRCPPPPPPPRGCTEDEGTKDKQQLHSIVLRVSPGVTTVSCAPKICVYPLGH